MLQSCSPEARPKPIFFCDCRDSRITGHAWFAVLQYKEHKFESPLPLDWTTYDEASQAILMAPILEGLRARLAPILIKEDQEEASDKAQGIIRVEPDTKPSGIVLVPG